MEFLEVLETVRADEASVEKLFGGEGQGVRHMGRKSPQYLKKLAETAKFMADIMTGKRPAYLLREALTTSDFPYLFGDILDRQLLANYQETPQVWPLYVKRSIVSDFRTVHRFAINGSEAVLYEVPQDTDYPESKIGDAIYSFAVKKYGRRIPFAWEAMINDDLDALKDIPARFGRAARRSEEKFATALHVDANGPHASIYTVAHKNIINATNAGGSFTAINPPLSIQALQQAMTVLANMVDSDGEPITIEAVTLEVPPALEITARNIMNAIQIWIEPNLAEGAGVEQRLISENWMRGKVAVAVNPYIPIVATSNGQTSWFLHANPEVGRPAFEMGFLRGHDMPEIFIKMPNQQLIGGGVDQMMGDFDVDAIIYKVRHVFGGVAEDTKMTVASNGSGS